MFVEAVGGFPTKHFPIRVFSKTVKTLKTILFSSMRGGGKAPRSLMPIQIAIFSP